MNTSTASGQRIIILQHLKQFSSLTTQESRDDLDIPHPAGRIYELRQSGYKIVTHWVVVHTSDGTLRRMAKYVLESGG